MYLFVFNFRNVSIDRLDAKLNDSIQLENKQVKVLINHIYNNQ